VGDGSRSMARIIDEIMSRESPQTIEANEGISGH
jgi:hypothetical protein